MHAIEDNFNTDVAGALGDTKMMLRRVLAGESVAIDRHAFSLHDLTQLALAMMPDATLAIRHAEYMTPLERASVATVGRGRVIFD